METRASGRAGIRREEATKYSVTDTRDDAVIIEFDIYSNEDCNSSDLCL